MKETANMRFPAEWVDRKSLEAPNRPGAAIIDVDLYKYNRSRDCGAMVVAEAHAATKSWPEHRRGMNRACTCETLLETEATNAGLAIHFRCRKRRATGERTTSHEYQPKAINEIAKQARGAGSLLLAIQILPS